MPDLNSLYNNIKHIEKNSESKDKPVKEQKETESTDKPKTTDK
jgi:hypothetical protein